MRKCVRCQCEMIEDYGLKVSSFLAGVAPVQLSKGQGIFSSEKGNIHVAICPKCGEVSLYMDDIQEILQSK